MLRAMDINGASAIVTGGASGIGAAAARQLAAKGAIVVVADLQADKGEALAQEIGGVFARVDVTGLAATAMSRNEPDEDGCRGAIVNLASVAAFDGQIGQASYSASKGGVVGMTLPVARDLSASGI